MAPPKTTRTRLADLTPAEQGEAPYSVLMQLRAGAYADHVGAMAVPVEIQRWAAAMAARHGPRVKVWFNTLPWIEALLVVRYGEALEHWPTEFSAFDAIRAARWADGTDVPKAITILPREGG